MSAFNVAQLVAIHFARTEHQVPIKTLAEQYSVSESTIRRAVAKVEAQQAKVKANVVVGATSTPEVVLQRPTKKAVADVKPPVAYTVGRQLAEESVSCHAEVKRPAKKWEFQGQAIGRTMRPRPNPVKIVPYEQTAMFLAFAAAK